MQRDTLRACYEEAGSEAFTCVGNKQRVTAGYCESERDELYECALPGMGACLTACRALHAAYDAEVANDGQGILESVGSCRFFHTSCEEQCWTLVPFEGRFGPIEWDASAWPGASTEASGENWGLRLIEPCLHYVQP